jgi:hypothetical protein
MNVSIFKDVKDTSNPYNKPIQVALDRIKNGSSKELNLQIRASTNKDEQKALKSKLCGVCFNGTFKNRSIKGLEQKSGLIILDFDGFENEQKAIDFKESLKEDAYIFAAWISPSNIGVKVLVKIPTEGEHKGYFEALRLHFNSEHWDVSSSNIDRFCFESYDPNLFQNNDSLIFTNCAEPEINDIGTDTPFLALKSDNRIIDNLLKWWEKKYPMQEGQRNQNAYVLAMAFNDFGINKSLAGYVLNQFATEDFKLSEIATTIDSAYRNITNFGTKYYEDEERINTIKAKLRRGASRKEIAYQLQESNLDEDVINSVLSRIEEENSKMSFWTKNDKGIIRIIHILFKEFLEDNGFYKFCPEGGKNYVFVKVTNNLIDHTSEKEIKDFVLNYLLDLDDVSIYNYFADNTRFFKDEFLTLLSTIEIYFIADSKDSAYLYYKNCAVKITKKEIIPIDYLDLGGYVWKDHVIDRNFNICDVTDRCDYKKFVSIYL